MLIDAHNHIWDVPWPPVDPYPNMGNAQCFLHQMDANGVDAAIVVCHLDEHDPNNNDNALKRAEEFPTRFYILANVHLNKPDALEKVKGYVGRKGLVGISYYLDGDDPCDWLKPGPVFDLIAENKLILNLNANPHQQERLRSVARHYADMPIFLCHLGGPSRGGEMNPQWSEVLKSAECPNIHVKVSGFAYFSRWQWEYPYADVTPHVERLREAYTSKRLLWGSDYPPTMKHMTYRMSLEVVRSHCPFLSDEEKADILGNNAARILGLA